MKEDGCDRADADQGIICRARRFKFVHRIIAAALAGCLTAVCAAGEINLPPVTPAEVERARAADPDKRLAGFVRELNAAAADWRLLPASSTATTSVWRLRINSPHAESLAVEFDGLAPPDGASLTIYQTNGGWRRRARPGPGAWRSDFAPGFSVVLEWRLASGAPRPPPPARLWHMLSDRDRAAPRPAFSPSPSGVAVAASGPLGTCDAEVEVARDGRRERVSAWQHYSDVSLGVVRLLIPSPRGPVFYCSASLIDNGAGVQSAFLLSAEHCFDFYQYGEVSTRLPLLAVQWEVDARADNGCATAPRNVETLNTGAEIIAWDAPVDYALLRLDRAPSPPLRYVSWSSRTLSIDSTRTRVFSFSYPGGGKQSYTSGIFAQEIGVTEAGDRTGCSGDAKRCVRYWMRWDEGEIRPGSSGGGVFDQRPGRPPRLVGVAVTASERLRAGAVTGLGRIYHYDYRLRLALEHGEAYYQTCVAETTSAVSFNCLRPTKARVCEALDAGVADCASIESVDNSAPAGWRLDFDHALQGGASLRSGGAVTGRSATTLHIVVGEERLLEFSWRVSSEIDFDFLEFHLNGRLLERISGELDWRRFTRPLGVGRHRLHWRYVKDFGANGGMDAGFIDRLVLHAVALYADLDKTLLHEGGEEARLRLRRLGAGGAWRVHVDAQGDAELGAHWRLRVAGAGALDESNVLHWPPGSSETLLIIASGEDDYRVGVDRYLRLSLRAVDSSDTAVAVHEETFELTIADNAPPEVVDIAAGARHTCALLSSGVARCWGDDTHGQLSAPRRRVAALAAGERHTCFALAAGGVECHGANTQSVEYNFHYGHIEGHQEVRTVRFPVVGISVDQSKPAKDAGMVREIAAGSWHNCALYEGGRLHCWGSNTYWPLGYGVGLQRSGSADPQSLQARPPPEVYAAAAGIRQLALGEQHSCALMESGGVLCWGGATREQPPPAALRHGASSPTRVVALSAGVSHTCALLEDRSVRCWGGKETLASLYISENPIIAFFLSRITASAPEGYQRQFSLPADAYRPPADLGAVAQLASGHGYTCAITSEARARCWGPLSGNTTWTASLTTPTPDLRPPADLGRVRKLAGGDAHVCALLETGQVRCWGRDDSGQLTPPVRFRQGVRVQMRSADVGRILRPDDAARVELRIERGAEQHAALRARIADLGEARVGADYTWRVVAARAITATAAATATASVVGAALTIDIGGRTQSVSLEIKALPNSTRSRLHWRLDDIGPGFVRHAGDDVEMSFLRDGHCPPLDVGALDVDGDGRVDADDLILLLRGGALAEPAPAPWRHMNRAPMAAAVAALARFKAVEEPDVDDDGRLGNTDARALIRALLDVSPTPEARRQAAECWLRP